MLTIELIKPLDFFPGKRLELPCKKVSFKFLSAELPTTLDGEVANVSHPLPELGTAY